MCGFAGIWLDSGSDGTALREAVDAMIAPIEHRGPDDRGVWLDPQAGIGLGFRRLAILDLSPAGHQPMLSQSGRFVVVFNGEIYNFRDLRIELSAKGVSFKGGSDTEVALAAIEVWGMSDAVKRFVGMFAMGVWDRRERRVWLVRDRLGIKPLHVCELPGGFAFASEIRSLARLPGFDRTLDPDALKAYLQYLYIPAPRTVYRRTQKLLPGHVLELRSPGAPLPASTPFWTAEQASRTGRAKLFAGSEWAAVDQLERLLYDAVGSRMVADVPLGALLSGGVDSSTVVALMQRQASAPVKTFAIGFDAAEHDESRHAEAVARHLGTEHHTLRISGEDALDQLEHVIAVFDEPFADPSQIPTLAVCRLARQHVTVALTGDGGDELFAGYNRYLHVEGLARRLAATPRTLRRMAAAAIGAMPAARWDAVGRVWERTVPGGRSQRLLGEKLYKLREAAHAESGEAIYDSLISTTAAREGWLRTSAEAESVRQARLRQLLPMRLADRAMLLDQETYLADDLLAKVDRVSMSVSLEARVPLLDHRVLEFSWRLPAEMKIRQGAGKWLLRQVLYRHVPRELVDRPKVGFSVPVAEWLQGALRPWAEELLANRQLRLLPFVDNAAVRQTWGRFLRGQTQHANALWAVLMLQAWRERHATS